MAGINATSPRIDDDPDSLTQPDLPIPIGPPPDPRRRVPIQLTCSGCGGDLLVFIGKDGKLEVDSDKCECQANEHKAGYDQALEDFGIELDENVRCETRDGLHRIIAAERGAIDGIKQGEY